MEYEKLDKRAILSWRLGRLISLIIISIILSIGTLITKIINLSPTIYMYIYIGCGLIITYKLLSLIFYPEIEYRQWKYLITEDKVEIHKGIFFINTTIIPIIRIQHISLSQGPINRKLGLYQVTISLASGAFTIEGLTEEKANKISEYLKNKLYTRLKSKGESI